MSIQTFWNTSRTRYILSLFIVWRLYLFLLENVGKLIPVKGGFLGSVPWANFDGVHYLTIAQFNYQPYEQAFFPLYPIVIGFFARNIFTSLPNNYIISGLLISNISFLICLFLFAHLISLVIAHKKKESTIRWSLAFLTFFPTSFYFASVYTESFFLLLVLVCFYLLGRKKMVWYGIVAGLASATRLVGAFFMVPIGLLAYMFYLARTYGDPLLFIHAQPAFGAGRSGGEFILLPQVFYRYFKIFTSVHLSKYTFWIAFLEFFLFNLALLLIWIAWRQKFPREWIYFSLAAIIVPSLTGTLSSIPRYLLVCFPIFIVLSKLPPKIRWASLVVSCIVFSILTLLFTRGYWVS